MHNLKKQDYFESLVSITNGQPTTNSLLVAKHFEKEHKNVLSKIREMIPTIEGMLKIKPTPFFEEITAVNPQNGQLYPQYLINRDGFSLLVMGFTGAKALEWKIKYIMAFNEMEKRLSAPPVIDNRMELAKLISKTPTKNIHAIKELFPEYFSYSTAPLSTNTVDEWINNCNITVDYIEHYPTTALYNQYLTFCNGSAAVGKKTFYKALESAYHLKKRQKQDGFRYLMEV